MLNHLNNEIVAAETLRKNFRDVLGDDDALIADTIEGETKLFDLIESGLKRVSQDEALISSIDAYIGDLSARKKRLKDRAGAMRAALCSAMETAAIKTREFAAGTISRHALPAKLEVSDESQVPARFWKPKDPTIDRTALKDALESGEAIPGCHMTNGGETIRIRIK